MGREQRSALRIGVTGGVGAGKSTVLELLASVYGFHVIRTDDVARRLMEPGGASYEAVCGLMGERVRRTDGSLDRAWLAGQLFGDEQLRGRMDALVHPLVWKAVGEEAERFAGGPVVIEAAVLEKEFRDNCQEMWYVYTSRENRVLRLMESRGYSRERCLSMMDSQASEEEFVRFSDAVIDNNGTAQETSRQVARLLEENHGAGGPWERDHKEA